MENPYINMQSALDELTTQGNLRTLSHALHEGRYLHAAGQRMLNLSSNDYLGLAADMELRARFLESLTPEDFLPSSSSSRLLTGNHPAFDELEVALARLYGAESTLVFNSGFDANTGILPAIAGQGDLILADKLVHASLIDGMRLSRASWFRFKHNKTKHLERLLALSAPNYRHIIIVTESLFSMDGDEAPLRELVRLKNLYPNVLLYVDEAHAFGLRGPRGLGCCEEQGCLQDVDFLVGTLGKAAASAGAFVVCRRVAHDFLVNHVRPFIFTTALPPVIARWSRYVLNLLPDMGERRQRLNELTQQLHRALYQLKLKCPSTSHIIPLIIGDSAEAVRRAEEMQRRGCYVRAVRPPTVPEGTARLRLSLRADMTDEEMEWLITCIKNVTTPK